MVAVENIHIADEVEKRFSFFPFNPIRIICSYINKNIY